MQFPAASWLRDRVSIFHEKVRKRHTCYRASDKIYCIKDHVFKDGALVDCELLRNECIAALHNGESLRLER